MKNGMKFLAIFMVFCMVIAGTVACGSSQTTESETTASSSTSGSAATSDTATTPAAVDYSKAEPVTFDVFSQTANFTGAQGGWFGKILKDKFNLTLNVISGQGEGLSLFQTRSAAGSLGDIIIFGSNIQNFVDSITAGLLMDMTSLLASEGKFITETYPLAVERMRTDYGNGTAVYGLPNNCTTEKATTSSDGNDMTYGNYLVWSAYKAAGSPQINTLEDLLPVLQKMQQAVPVASNGKKTYGFSLFKDWDGTMMSNAKQYACCYGVDEWGYLLVNATGDKYESILDPNGLYYRNLKFYHDANKLGLLDPDSATQTFSDMTDKLKYGQILANWWPWCCQGQYNTAANVAKTADHEPDGYVLIPIKDQKIYSNGFYPSGSNYEIAIGSKCKDPSRAMALLNWLYSPEGAETSYDGPRGLTWELVGGKGVLTEFGKVAVLDPKTEVSADWGGGTYEDGQNKLNDFRFVAENTTDPNTGEPYIYSRWTSYNVSTDLMVEWSEKIGGGAKTVHEFLEKNNMITVAPGTNIQNPVLDTDTTTKSNNVRTIIRKYSWLMVMTKDDTEFNNYWNQMITEAKQQGIDDIDKVYIAQWEKLRDARAEAAATAQ